MTPRLLALLVLLAAARAQDPHHAVPGLTRGGLEPRLRGGVLLGELGCTACHAPPRPMDLPPRTAPDLAQVGARVDPRYIRRFLLNPQAARPGTVMPDVLARLPERDRERAADALTSFLVTRAGGRFVASAPDPVAGRRGRELFHHIGCAACHAPRDERGEERAMPDSVPLGRLEAKYSIASLTRFLDDPLAVRPSGRMPHFRLSPRESADLAHYLLERVRVPSRIRYTLFLPALGEDGGDLDLGALDGREHAAGVLDAVDPGRFARHTGGFAVRFAGDLLVPRAGEYTFAVRGDRTRVSIGGAAVVDATGRGVVRLGAGRQRLVVESLHLAGAPRLELAWSGPGFDLQPLPPSAFAVQDADATPPATPDPALAPRGAELFRELGCAHCHGLPEVEPPARPAPLEQLDPAAGCLAGRGDGPRYALSEAQRADLRAALAAPSFHAAGEPLVRQHLAAFNCVACHQRGDLGGITEARDEQFQAIGEGLGPSSRIPPPLTGVGAKLQPEWLADTLAHGQSIRPAMRTRMPGFGAANTAGLAALFGALDTLPAVELIPLPKPRKAAEEVTRVGQLLAGDKGMNCIACHQFAGHSASTMVSVDLVETTTRRLRPGWFYHYMLNPVKFRPGTIMPLFFPGGVSTRKDIEDGDAKRQLSALWHYLDKGRNVRPPAGLVQPSMEIEVGGEAVMLRRSVQNTGKRGISVGFPEKVSYTFDAESLALNQVWWGRFVDPRAVWSGQGSGQVRIMERDKLELPLGPSIAFLADRQAPWPEGSRRDLGQRFRGYDLDGKRRPAFLYEYDGVQVTDAPVATRDGVLRRTFTFQSARARTLYFRAAVDPRIEPAAGGRVRVGRLAELRVPAESVVVRDARGTRKPSRELLLEVPLKAGRTTLVVEYARVEGGR